ncbi:MAG: RluA family pseudouridine synthase [Lachnospiraceae bacterium]|nr:RluA family pseudouridine synthase [Lachnospiraceae bacterium]
MNRQLQYIIDENKTSVTVEAYLRSRGYSHKILAHLKRTPDGIRKNGVWARVTETLSQGDVLDITLTDPAQQSPPDTQKEDSAFFHAGFIPADLPVSFVYEDEDILVISKPPRMSVHPSAGNYENTCANAAAWHFMNEGLCGMDARGRCHFTFHCINRLDRDTSGLLIIAKNLLSGAVLGAAMKERRILRTYLAIAEGKTGPEGTICAPIARVPGSALMREVSDQGEYALTRYKRLEYDETNDLSLLEIHLETGRTHQIRVHMLHTGHPLIGDFLYNPGSRLMQRQALHSSDLVFRHPITGADMHFHAPLPSDMQKFFISY